MKKMILVLVAVLMAWGLVPTTAQAGPINVGTPLCPVGDWSQRFQEDGNYNGTHYNFDQIFAVMVTTDADGFMSPGMRNFSDGSWASTGDAHSVTSWGVPVGYLQWDYMFLPQNPPPTSTFDAWTHLLGATGSESWWGTRITYNNGSWSYQNLGQGPDAPDGYTNPVPEPASMLLLGTGLIGLGAKFRRRRK